MADVAAEAVVVCKHCSGGVYLATSAVAEETGAVEVAGVAAVSAEVAAVAGVSAVVLEVAAVLAEAEQEVVGS